MSAEDRLQALEQLVTVMQSEVISARTAAAQAEQRATEAETRGLGVRGEGVVDTRLLGKPKNFDGTTDNWRQFKFTFLGYAGAVDSRLEASNDRKRSVAGKRNHELSLACQRPTSLNEVLHFGTALGGISATLAGTRKRW